MDSPPPYITPAIEQVDGLEPPRYDTYVQTLYFSKSEWDTTQMVTRVSTSPEADYHTAYFKIELTTSSHKYAFKVVPDGQYYTGAHNDFYYRYTECPGSRKNTGFFRISGGRGTATPCQVENFSSFVDFGLRRDGVTYAQFMVPFRSGKQLSNGLVTKYEWSVQPSTAVEKVFRLAKWDERAKGMKTHKEKLNLCSIAEFSNSPNGSTLMALTMDPLWESMEECAYIVGSVFCALLALSSDIN
ncbi:hypothetical protein HDU84_001974 [Entophlyctis sp. JEL0112]|nr:hypothetical protein HDU84_001974 [Entophlyctis sp. JEL0112]